MNSMPFRQLKSFLKILIGIQYEIENVTIQQNPVPKKHRIFCINVTSSQKNALSCGMIKPQSINKKDVANMKIKLNPD